MLEEYKDKTAGLRLEEYAEELELDDAGRVLRLELAEERARLNRHHRASARVDAERPGAWILSRVLGIFPNRLDVVAPTSY